MKRLGHLTSALLLCICARSQVSAGVYSFTSIADTTTAAPIGMFDEFESPAVSGDTVAFIGSYVGGRGVFRGEKESLTTIVKTGDIGPIGPIGYVADAAISGNRVAFYAGHSVVMQTASIYVGDGGPLTTIAQTGQAAPVGVFWRLGYPTISGSQVAFRGFFSELIPDQRPALFVGDGGPLTPVTDPAKVTPFADYFFDGNSVAFVGSDGVFVSDGGMVSTVAQAGIPTSVGTFVAFLSPSIHGQEVGFVGLGNNEAVFTTFDGSAYLRVLSFDDPGPFGSLISIENVVYDGETIAFASDYVDSEGGPNKTAIFTIRGGEWTKVLDTGDSVFGSTVTGLEFGRFGLDPDGSGNLAFGYQLADGRRGIALASVVPEPSAMLLLGVAWTTIVAVQQRQRRWT